MKAKESLSHVLGAQLISGRHMFQDIVLKESEDPSAIISPHHRVEFNVNNAAQFHQSPSKHCPAGDLNCKPRQDSTSLDKIREARSAQQ